MKNDTNEKTNPLEDMPPEAQSQATPPQEASSQIPHDKNEPCVNHPDKVAFRICKMCSRAFCLKCLTHHMGIYYCDECRKSTISAINAADENSEKVAAQFNRISHTNDTPDYSTRAFKWALIGLIPAIGIVISIIALFWGFSAISHPSLVPDKKKSQKAMYAVIISAGSIIVQIIIGLILLILLGR